MPKISFVCPLLGEQTEDVAEGPKINGRVLILKCAVCSQPHIVAIDTPSQSPPESPSGD